jgi:phosphatidylinositol-3-phosphatase
VNRLVRRYGLAANSYGVRHPSLPDYLALTSGSTHGIDSDCTGCHVSARNVVDQLEAAGISWKAYMEDMPQPCFGGASARGYAKKHNPFAYYDDVAANRARCHKIVPFEQLATDLRRGALPTYVFISPNLCNDMHDCSVATGDRFLARLVPVLLRALGPEGYLVLTWDEGISDHDCCGGSRGGHIATIVAGPLVRRGARAAGPLDHYGVLRTVEDSLGLPRLGAARDGHHGDLTALFTRAPRLR